MVAEDKGDTVEQKKRNILLGVLICGGNKGKGLAIVYGLSRNHI